MTKILIVEDERIIALDLQARLERLGYDVLGVVSSGEDVLKHMAMCRPDVALMDITLKGEMDGIEIGQQLRDQFHVPVIYLTAHDDDATVKRAKITHPFGYLVKPYQEKTLHRTIQMALHNHQLERKLKISSGDQQRIGQDLHDNLCQQLTGITLLMGILEKKLSDQLLPEAEAAREIQELIVQAMIHTRMLAKGLLIPVDFEVLGLQAALEDIASSTERLTTLSCRVECGSAAVIRDRTIATHLYRIAQEAVANAVKHARARHIVIALSQKNGEVTLSITDDGIGIPEESLRKGRLGLSVMNSRAETIHATLRIQRGGHGGTVVRCLLRPRAGRPSLVKTLTAKKA